MPLLIGYDASGLDGKLRTVIDDIVARIQIWAGGIEGINAAQRLNELATGISSLPTPLPGFFQPYGGSTAPTGWLMCDGSAVSRDTYANLYAVIGTTYGAGNGTTTFNVPDFRQRFPLGKAASGTGATLGATGGTIDHVHTGPSHTHTGPSHTHSISASGTHVHEEGTLATGALVAPGTEEVQAGTGATVAAQGHFHNVTSGETAAGGNHDHGAVTGSGGTGNTGASGTGNTGSANPAFIVVNWLVKT